MKMVFVFLAALALQAQSTFVKYNAISAFCDPSSKVTSVPDQGPLNISLTTPTGFTPPDCSAINGQRGIRFSGLSTIKQGLRGFDTADKLHSSVFTLKAVVTLHGAPAPNGFGFILGNSGDGNGADRSDLYANGAGQMEFKIISGPLASDITILSTGTPVQLGIPTEFIGSLDANGTARLLVNGNVVKTVAQVKPPIALPTSSRPSVTIGGATTGFSICNCTIFTAEIRDDANNYSVPAISKSVNGASFLGPLGAGGWGTITGTNLGSATEDWGKYINGQVLPTSVGNVSVKVGNIPATVYYVATNQVNFVVPNIDQVGVGQVDVSVTNSFGTATVKAIVQPSAPGWFGYSAGVRLYAAATNAAGVTIGKVAGTVPAKRGETIILYGTGFGPTNPVLQTDRIPKLTAALVASPQVRIGEVPADVLFAGINGFIGLVQINIVVPISLPDGEFELKGLAGGVETPPVYIVISGDVSP